MTFNRIKGNAVGSSGIHWAFRAKGEPKGLKTLLASVRAALGAEGLEIGNGHAPHVTISYNAPALLPSMPIELIEWIVDELLLVKGDGNPYRYVVIERWPLAPLPEPSHLQLSLLQ